LNKIEYAIQKALGLIYDWDVYVMFIEDNFYTIYRVEAPTKKEALRIGYEKIRASGRKIKQTRNNYRGDIFTIGPNPIQKMANAKHAKTS